MSWLDDAFDAETTDISGMDIVQSASGYDKVGPNDPLFGPFGTTPVLKTAGYTDRVATEPTPTTVTTRTYIPGTEGIAATPAQYATYTTLEKIANHGWDTYARSIAPLLSGSYIVFQAADGITGACLAIGAKGLEGQGTHLFSHALIIDVEGVRVYEKGDYAHRMRLSHDPITSLRIHRHIDNKIVYTATTGQETLVYTSSREPSQPSFSDMFVYGYLYASGDRITAASFKVGEVQYGSV